MCRQFVSSLAILVVTAGLPAHGDVGGGALDAEIPNRARVKGTIDAPRELKTLCMTLPERPRCASR